MASIFGVHFDPTPGFNLGVSDAYNKATGQANNLGSKPSTASNPLGTSSTSTGKNAAAAIKSSTQQGTDEVNDPYSAGSAQNAADNAAYQGGVTNLNDLLGRLDPGLNQGLSQLNDSYQNNVNQQTNQENQALQDYSDQRIQTNQDKLGAYNTINKNANNGYRSLAQIIGRASGTGSTAFQELLPDVVGRDTSAKRGDANQVFASNLGNIDTAQKKTENSFAQILADIANQRNAGEQQLRTGVEQQRQGLLGQQQQLEAQRGNAAGVSALQGQIGNSRNAVESFFNQFKPTITAQQAAIAAPDLNQYSVDRSNVNAQQSGGNPANPYADILRKKLQEQNA